MFKKKSKCPNCGNPTHENELSCMFCGKLLRPNPDKIPKPRKATIVFANVNSMFTGGGRVRCRGHLLKCKRGGTIVLLISQATDVIVSIAGYLGKKKATLVPGDKIYVDTNIWGFVKIAKHEHNGI